jgi:hypothetical protein
VIDVYMPMVVLMVWRLHVLARLFAVTRLLNDAASDAAVE